jgi:NADPH:quinone reductase-like Zn-dependent oxidoreductase/acyl carrier protein
VLADNGGIADALIARLVEQGSSVVRIERSQETRRTAEPGWDSQGAAIGVAAAAESRSGPRPAQTRDGPPCSQGGVVRQLSVADDSEDDLRRVIRQIADSHPCVAGWLHCWSLDHPSAESVDLERLEEAHRTGVLSVFRLLRAAAPAPPRMWCAVRDVYAVEPEDRSAGLASAPLVGLTRVAHNEFFPVRFTVVDVGADAIEVAGGHLFKELTAGDDEREVAYRSGRRHALRLKRAPADQLPVRRTNAVRPDGARVPFRLQSNRPGVLANLALHETARRDPGPDEVEVRVLAGGINFRDVMKALGTYPGNPIDLHWYGDDVSGVVERVGANVRHLRAGDAVVGLAPYAFRAYVTVPARMVFPKPKDMTFQQAATIPTVFLTAHYALISLARMRAGESVLIHGGAGGVGQAAIQIARRLGLEIFATAGSPEKRQLLAGQGVAHVLNSRTLQFADQIRDMTRGRGVDAVLNSFAGEFIPKSLSVLAPFGRFLEIGKVDVYRDSRIGLQRLKDNISYFVIDLAQHMQQKQELVAEILAEVSDRFVAGDYLPLPHTVFPVTQAVDAFRHMAQGKHIGKNVLSFAVNPIPIAPCTEPEHRLRSDATYLITGGASGFCLEIAKWMAGHGARHLVLFSRSGPRDEAAAQDIQRLRHAGTTVIDARGDVTVRVDVRRVVQQIRSDLPPLKGVLHGAMVLDDEFVINLDESRFRKALDPKVSGAWNLHLETLDLPLDHFICFSSLSTVLGGPKQSNYNAGNYFLDALAHYRQARGLPALTINWGAIMGAGFVERNRKTADYLDKIGMKSFELREALHVFDRLLLADPVEITAGRADWSLLPSVGPAIAQSNTFSALIREGKEADRGGSLAARLKGASPELRQGLIEEFIATQVAGVFGTTAQKVDRDTPLHQLGLDSLMAIELKNRIEQEAGITLPVTEIMHGPTLTQLAGVILAHIAESAGGDAIPPAAADSAESPPGSPPPANALVNKIDDLSDQEVDLLLATMLQDSTSSSSPVPSSP